MTGTGPVARAAGLDWRPALDHAELLAPGTLAALRSWAEAEPAVAREAVVAEIDPGLADTAAFCARYGVAPHESANCVIVAARRGGETRYAAVLVPANTRADVNGVVRRHLQARKASFAPHQDAVDRTGMEYGGITPIGLPGTWPVLIDEAVAAAPFVVIGSGVRRSKLALSGAALTRLKTAEVLSLAIPATP